MDDVINEFIAEAREGIEAVDAKLVRFEQTPDDPDLLGDIFRLIHSLKGGSGFLGLMRLQSVTHAAENVLGLYRDGTLAVDAASVTVILDAVDVVRAVIEGLADTGVEPEGDDRALIGRLDRIYAGDSAPAATASAASRSLLERVGGEATLDAACEGALALLVTVPVTGPLFAGIDLDRVQAEWREALCGVARATAAPGALQRALAETFGEALTTHEAAFVQAVRQNLIDLEAEAEAVDMLLAAPPAEREAEPARADRAEPAKGPQTIRVGVDTLEGLMTMVSELVRTRVEQRQDQTVDLPGSRPWHQEQVLTHDRPAQELVRRGFGQQPFAGEQPRIGPAMPQVIQPVRLCHGGVVQAGRGETGQGVQLANQIAERDGHIGPEPLQPVVPGSKRGGKAPVAHGRPGQRLASRSSKQGETACCRSSGMNTAGVRHSSSGWR